MRCSTAVLVLVLALLGCDDSEAPKPAAPPPEIAVAMHVHFGRPGATMGMAMRLVSPDVPGKDAAAPDAVSILSEATGLEPAVVGLADLLQPADVLVVDSGGARHRLVSVTAVPDVGKNLPEGLQMKAAPEGELPRVVGTDGRTRCVVASERLWCSGSGGEQLAGLSRAAQPMVDKWARDRTDAVIELEGAALREMVWPALKGDAAILSARVAARLAHEVEGPLGSWITVLGKRSAEPLWAVVDRAVVRVRLDGGQARLEARLDVDRSSDGANRGMGGALAALAGSAPLSSALGHLPVDQHGLMLRADAGLSDGVVMGEVGRIAEGQPLAEKVAALQASLLPGVVGSVTWAGRRRVLMEAQRSRDPEATKKALDGLVATVAAAGERPALTIRSAGGGLTIATEAFLAHVALVADAVVIASGDAADTGIDDGALAALIPPPQVIPSGTATPKPRAPSALAVPLSPYAVGLGLMTGQLATPGRAKGMAVIGLSVTEKTPKHLRAALMMQADRAALGELAQMLRLGRAKRPDPALARRDEDEAGDAR